MEWKEIAEEYRKELTAIHKDIHHACVELEKRMPRTHERVIAILEKALNDSEDNLRMLKMVEPIYTHHHHRYAPKPKDDSDLFNTMFLSVKD